MEQEPYTDIPHIEKQKVSFWRKLGGGSLTISLIVHGIFLVIGIFIVVQTIKPDVKPPVDMINSGGGGQKSGTTKDKKKVNVVKNQAARVVALGATSSLSLPEQPPNTDQKATRDLPSSGAAGLGGSGTGGGLGSGNGLGMGAGNAAGIGNGKNPFGDIKGGGSALVGVMYDLKQTSSKKSTGMTPGNSALAVSKFFQGGWNERLLSPYYQATQKLYQTRIYIPFMAASAGPAAFQCEKEIAPAMWCVVYRGDVIAPFSGKFRFVGRADDMLAVRFDRKNAFDYGCFFASSGNFNPVCYTNNAIPNEPSWVKLLGPKTPMKLPIPTYSYPQTSRNLGLSAIGPTFSVTKGQSYPIEILISEVPGGGMSFELFIEEDGKTYEKTSDGAPILPLFRTENILPPAAGGAGAPFATSGPVWTVKSRDNRPAI